MNVDPTAKEGPVVTQTLRETVRSGRPTTGTFINLGSALAVEICAMAGFDWLLVDLEHGAGGEQALLGQLHAAAAHGVPVIVRIETAERIRAGRVLDLGAHGVMFPRLETVVDAQAVIKHVQYPPDGDRGVASYNRARLFGADTRSACDIGDSIVRVLQIETIEALTDVEAIAGIPGVDVLFVGPGDLSYALGVPGRFDAPVFVDALSRIADAARNAGIAAGILASDETQAAAYREAGFSFIAVGSDSTILAAATRRLAAALRTP